MSYLDNGRNVVFPENLGSDRSYVRPSFSKRGFVEERYSVLLIDDDADQLIVLEALLSGAGLNVFTVKSAAEARTMMQRNFFDVVVTDLKMPGTNGFQLVESLRSVRTIPDSAHIPIVILSSCSEDSVEQHALEVGADMYCQKQNAGKDLVTKIRVLLDRDSAN